MFKWDRFLRNKKLPKSSLNQTSNETDYNFKSREIETIDNKEEFEIVEVEILPKKIICPDCGGITLEGLDFCDKCGGVLQS